MNVVVTGGAGFIGARAVAALLARGHRVAVLLRPTTSRARLAALQGSITVIQCALDDLTSAESALRAFRPECCLHLAWYAEPGSYLDSPRNFHALAQTVNLLQLLPRLGCKRVVMAGTCAEYVPAEVPLREDAPVAPASLYAAAKLSALMLGEQYARLHGLRLAWGRVFLLYGPGEDERRAIPALVRTLRAGRVFDATEGLQRRDFLHVDDVAEAFATLCESQADGVYNIASGEGPTLREIFTAIQTGLGLAGRIRFGAIAPRGWEPPMLVGDNARLQALGWRPRFSLAAGLDTVVRDLA
jgi:nucleoside-diphosphate-sugar epimerase